jgi:hypothetical protein
MINASTMMFPQLDMLPAFAAGGIWKSIRPADDFLHDCAANGDPRAQGGSREQAGCCARSGHSSKPLFDSGASIRILTPTTHPKQTAIANRHINTLKPGAGAWLAGAPAAGDKTNFRVRN